MRTSPAASADQQLAVPDDHGGSSAMSDKDRRFELSLETKRERRNMRIGVLLEEDFEEVIGSNWRIEKPGTIDLSAEKFKLETLTGPEPFKGLMNGELHRKKITYIDISDNRLRDIGILTEGNDFISLHVLVARRNMISSPNLVLPKLMELNLSNNEMKILPVLSGMPLLEVLIVHHNQLEGSFEKLQHNRRLRRVDLAHNNYRISPGQLTTCLEALAQLVNLTSLRIMENPFVAYIKEYQIFVLKKLKELQKLDDIPITDNIRSELEHYDKLYTLDAYNEVFEERRDQMETKEFNKKELNKQSGKKMSQFPQFVAMVMLLDEVNDDSSVLLKNVTHFRELAGYVVELFGQILGARDDEEAPDADPDARVEDDFWSGYKERFKKEDQAMAHLLELILNCMERHDSVRMQLTESLGCLACLGRFGFGLKCVETLGKLMISSESGEEEVVATLNQVIIPALEKFTGQSMNTPHCQTLIEGLVLLMKNEEKIDAVAGTVTPLMDKLMTYVLDHSASDSAYCIKLLAYTTYRRENVERVHHVEFVKKIIVTLENPTIAEAMEMRSLWLDTLQLALNVAVTVPDSQYALFEKAALHVRLLAKLKSIRGQGLHTNKDSQGELSARTVQRVLQFLSGMMERNQTILRECCTGYHIVKELTEFVKEHKCKGYILCEAVKTITMILADPLMRRNYISIVVKELSKLKLCLQYLGLKSYDDLFEQGQKQPLHALDAGHDANKVIIAMLGIISFFADDDPEDETDDGQKELVNRYLNTEQREKVVLGLLVAPNEDVKMAVLECIAKVPVEQIEGDEMGLLVKFLADSKNIGAGNMEIILAKAIQQLEKLADGDTPTHELFRSTKADEALAKTYDILRQNSGRDTCGHASEEKEKRNLSIACVSFFSACSKYQQLQEFMRSTHIHNTLYKILKFEEELHTPSGPCVAIEQTWAGRSISNLMRCVTPSDETLARTHKVAFRLMTRIADVLEGRTDGLRERTTGYTLKEICKREALMLNGSSVDGYLRHLNDPEWADRNAEANNFVECDGVARIFSFLSHSKTIEREVVYQKQIEEASDLKRTIQGDGREKQVCLETDEVAAKDQSEEPIVDLDNFDDDVTYEAGSGLKALMCAAQSCEDTVDEDDDSIFVTPPSNFEIEEFDEHDEVHFDENGGMSMSYIISAALRIVHALLKVPVNNYCRTSTVQVMREPKMVKRLMTLVENQTYLSCNLAAKFLNVMILALDVGVFGASDPGSRLEILSLLSRFTAKMAAGMVKLLRLTKDKRLNLHQQTLSVEIARLMAMITRIVPFFKVALFGERLDVQEMCMTKTLDWLIPRDGLRLCIAMILYELQLDAGAGIGKEISKNYVLEVYKKQQMKERATHFLSLYMTRCPEKKYDILEVFSVAEVFQRMQVRPSYLRELLNDTNSSSFMLFTEGLVASNTWPELQGERMVNMAVCKAADVSQSLSTCMICTGGSAVWMLKPAAGAPPYKNDQAGSDWDPSWELEFPREPTMLWQRKTKEVSRVFRLFSPQMLGIEWIEEETNGSGGGFASRLFGKKKTDNCTVLLFERARDRERLTRALQRHSKTDAKVLQTKKAAKEDLKSALTVLSDATVKVPIMKAVGKHDILMASCAFNIASGFHRMFVLTTEKVIEFQIDMGAWSAPDSSHTEPPSAFDDAFMPLDVASEVHAHPGGDRPIGTEEVSASGAKHNARVSGHDKAIASESNSQLFAFVAECKLPPKEIRFDDTSECPDLVMKFPKGGDMTIRFYDDTGREDWRRALAYYLANKAEVSWGRMDAAPAS